MQTLPRFGNIGSALNAPPIEKLPLNIFKSKMKLQVLKSHLTAKTGYGELARNMVAALMAHGWEIWAVDDTPASLEMVGVRLISKNQPHVPILYITCHHNLYTLHPGQISIIRTMMETDSLNYRWVKKLGRADAVWVPSRFNRDSFISAGLDKNRVCVVRYPVDTDVGPAAPYPFKTRKRFRFLSVFDSVTWYRKGADFLLKAYYYAFSHTDDVCLVIKTNCSYEKLLGLTGVDGKGALPRVEVIDSYLPDSRMYGLYTAADAYVMPSRAEGIGRPYLYAMAAGLPAIGTGWSGNSQFMTQNNSYLLDYTLKYNPWDLHKTVTPLHCGVKYAEPSIKHLAETMRFVFQNPGAAAAKGRIAEKDIRNHHSYTAVAKEVEHAFQKLSKNPAPHQPLDIFESMYPLFFPGSKQVNLIDQDRLFSKQTMRRIAIYGTGEGGKNAHRWVKRFKHIEEIVFLDRDLKKGTYLDCQVSRFEQFQYGTVDLILVATAPFFVPQILENLKKYTTIPIYFFGA